jgi:hypothetical protein
MNPLYSWLRERGFWIPRGSDVTPTHVFLDGGKAAIPQSELHGFFEQYKRCIERGYNQYAVERVSTDKFRYFIDIDLDVNIEHDDIIKEVISVVSYLLDKTSDIVVCSKKTCDSRPLIKGGIHIVWMDVVVDTETAMQVREEAICRLDDKFDKIEKVFDGTVYRGSGLRMLHSRKRNGYDVYLPSYTISKEGVFCSITDPDDVRWLQKCSLRYFSLEDTGCISKRPCPANIPLARKPSVVVDTEHVIQIMAIIPSEYSPCKVISVQSSNGQNYLITCTSKYCANIGRRHNSNHVYFVAKWDGLYQKCHCSCKTLDGRKHGYCKDFCRRVADAPAFLKREIVRYEMFTDDELLDKQCRMLGIRSLTPVEVNKV